MIYPGKDGPIDSLRWEVFAESLQDYAILQTAAIDPANRRNQVIADLDKAIPRLVMSAFANAGQVCLSLQRLFVHTSIADTVIERLVEETKALKVAIAA